MSSLKSILMCSEAPESKFRQSPSGKPLQPVRRGAIFAADLNLASSVLFLSSQPESSVQLAITPPGIFRRRLC
jgi:hypothetical protein